MAKKVAKSPTPLTDLVRRLLSAKCPVDAVVEALAAAEAISTMDSGRNFETLNRRRAWDRERKRAARVLSTQASGGKQKPIYILTTSSLSESNKGKKESKNLTPAHQKPAPGALVPLDDWPSDYEAQFWAAYPPGRKIEKKAVFLKLKRMRRDREVTFAKLMEGVARYVASSPGEFTKGPLRWLNKGCWDDEHAIPGKGARAPVARQESFRDILMGGSHGGR